jgi:monofunctional biosynthetic peptidoglycan transglycosylase
MLMRCGAYFIDDKPVILKYKWKSKEKISHNLQLAVVAAEDQKFYEHAGFDVEAIKKAIKYNESHNKTKGGSTISQQCAKNVFLWQGRNWLRKGLEVYFTALIELFWSKERILEVSLNVVEMGIGVYGAEAAAKYYYNKTAAELTKKEAALLAAILPNPRKWDVRKPTNYIIKRQNWILKQMNNLE